MVLLLPLAGASCGDDDGTFRVPTATSTNATAEPTPTGRPQATPTAEPVRTPGPGGPVSFELAFPGLPAMERPTVLIEIPGQDRMLLALQEGRVVSFEKSPAADALATVFDHRDRTARDGNEEGLLGMTLDPEFERNGYIYLYYNVEPGDRRTQISRFETEGTGADFRIVAESELAILTVSQPFGNHNGGQLSFGPDGMLYLGLGDGGSGGDPSGNGQDITRNLLGSIIRIDVRGATAEQPYRIPPDNPWADGRDGARPETWAYGLRNPWRFSWDPETGGMIAGDVGQGQWEEIDVIEKGKNYGWNIMEGPECFRPANGCDMTGLELPIAAYTHDEGCSVTGGYVYRGSRVPALWGAYVYADYCSGMVWSLPAVFVDDAPEPVVLAEEGPRITSFAVDLDGELYLLGFDGRIFAVVP